MGQEGGVREGLFGLLKGMGQRRGPGKCFWSPDKGVSEGAENGGGMRNKTAVKINEAKTAL